MASYVQCMHITIQLYQDYVPATILGLAMVRRAASSAFHVATAPRPPAFIGGLRVLSWVKSFLLILGGKA